MKIIKNSSVKVDFCDKKYNIKKTIHLGGRYSEG